MFETLTIILVVALVALLADSWLKPRNRYKPARVVSDTQGRQKS